MRTDRGLGTIEAPRHFLGWQIFHIAKYQRGAFPRRQAFEARRQPGALFRSKYRGFRRLNRAEYPPYFGRLIPLVNLIGRFAGTRILVMRREAPL